MKFSKLFGFITAFDINRDKGKSQKTKKDFKVLATKSMLVTVLDGCWRQNMLVTSLRYRWQIWALSPTRYWQDPLSFNISVKYQHSKNVSNSFCPFGWGAWVSILSESKMRISYFKKCPKSWTESWTWNFKWFFVYLNVY